MKSYVKVEVFRELLDRFETDDIKKYCMDMIAEIPDYIFIIPSSTTGKYHNATQCQMHGQLFHIYAFGRIMNYMLDLEYNQHKFKSPIQRDLLRCTPILHDGWKCGETESKYTVFEHPVIAGEKIRTLKVTHDINQDYKNYLADLCASHSGQWTTSKRSDVVLPKPNSEAQYLVHLCDYLSSRNDIDLLPTDNLLKACKQVEDAIASDKYIFTFGKYQGEEFDDVLKQDSNYIEWLKNEYDSIDSLMVKLKANKL